MRVAAAILAAGRGDRFGGDKTAFALGGKPLWRWSYDTFAVHPRVDAVFLVTAPERVDSLSESVPVVIAGGTTRRESSLAALTHAETLEADVLLLQDAARPFTSAALIASVVDAILAEGAAAPGLAVTDTIKEVLPGRVRTLQRGHLVAMQTPQGARVDLLRRAHAADISDATDDMALVEAIGVHPRIVTGEPSNFKITTREDFARASAMVGAETRTGIGYDVHAFSEDPARRLFLGGVEFPDHRALAGHSDADVLLHAVTDAVLGAAGLGDIGLHFPPSEAQWRDRASSFFLDYAGRIIASEGWRVINIDTTCIAENPKIMSRAAEIRAAIGNALQLDAARVSVKATTNEGLGSIGRGEGIAAIAIATLSRTGTAP